MKSHRIEDLSTIQLAASVLAAVTGAVLGSFLGVGGTVAGVALVSFASTASNAVYKHYLGRTGDRLREMGPKMAGRAREARERASRGRDRTAGGHTGGPHGGHASDLGDDLWWRKTAGPGQQPIEANPPPKQPRDMAARSFPQQVGPRDGGVPGTRYNGAGAHGDKSRRAGGTGAGGKRRPRILVLAGIAAGIFIVAMTAVTVVEALAGKPLASLVGTHHGSGTTVGSVVGGGNTGKASPTPSEPTPVQSTPAAPTGPTSTASTPPTSRTPLLQTPASTPAPTPAATATAPAAPHTTASQAPASSATP